VNYTINDKEYSEFDINIYLAYKLLDGEFFLNIKSKTVDLISFQTFLGGYGEPHEKVVKYGEYDPFNNPSDTWPIIEKCFDELMNCYNYDNSPRWENIMDDHNCTKLVAACIWFIEINEAKQ
tara:strand:+ start:42 stop:407 length:366 start_codon:yes stop_codon:yes gene_type:complete